MNPIKSKFDQRSEKSGSLVCVGLDTDTQRLPDYVRSLPLPQWEWNRSVIDATAPYAAAYKPNMAFYEAEGSSGLNQLTQTLDYLRDQHPDIVTICDAKRADIGSTSEAYARSIFDHFQFDAVTLNPYLGYDALAPFLERDDKLNVVLCRTSNPSSGEFQTLEISGKPLWQVVAETVMLKWNKYNNCALVVGANHPDELRWVRQLAPEVLVLVPGLGAQGGDLEATLAAGLDQHRRGLMLNASRSILFAPSPADAARQMRDAINHCRYG